MRFKSRTRAKEAHMARAYPGFHSMKQLRVLLLPPGQDASQSQGYPQQCVAGIHLYTWVERDNVGQSILSKETTQWQGLGIKPPTFKSEVQCTNHYTTGPPQMRFGGALMQRACFYFFFRGRGGEGSYTVSSLL